MAGMEPRKPQDCPPLWRLVWECVRQDRIPLRAAAMAYQTLVSWLPLAMIVMAILSGPAFESQRELVLDHLASGLLPNVPGMEPEPAPAPEPSPSLHSGRRGGEAYAPRDLQTELKEKLRRMLSHLSTNVGQIGFVSFVLLLGMAILLFRTVEDTFNAIWKVNQLRPFLSRLAILTTLIFWLPVLATASILIAQRLTQGTLLSAYLLPFLFTAGAFTCLYLIMPNAKVRKTAALTGGVAAAALWEVSKVGFLIYLRNAVGYSHMYGSMGVVPVLFLWIFVSWIVILAGAELAYIVQHHRVLAEQWENHRALSDRVANAESLAQREAALLPVLTLAAAIEIAQSFRDGSTPGGLRRSELAECLGVEPGTLARALNRLVEEGLIVAAAENGGGLIGSEVRYLPAADPATCATERLLQACQGTLPPLPRDRFSWETAARILARRRRADELPPQERTLAGLAAEVSPAPAATTPLPSPIPEPGKA